MYCWKEAASSVGPKCSRRAFAKLADADVMHPDAEMRWQLQQLAVGLMPQLADSSCIAVFSIAHLFVNARCCL